MVEPGRDWETALQRAIGQFDGMAAGLSHGFGSHGRSLAEDCLRRADELRALLSVLRPSVGD